MKTGTVLTWIGVIILIALIVNHIIKGMSDGEHFVKNWTKVKKTKDPDSGKVTYVYT